VTPERRGPGRLSGSRKRARLLTFVALAGLAGLAIAGAARFGQLAPRSPELIAWFLIACASAALLGIALLAEMRRLERIEAAQAASEHRFRMAVEAARCGIWEWDLSSDQIYMSEVTAALFGWRGGVVPGQQVLDRAAPGHRDDLRDALTNAAIYGDFDVSFRVPPLAGARPVWIDFRGRGFGESPEGGFARIIGVGLDVTEERLAQARAQAAESRLRDAIESTSEAFVLWDRGGRLAMWNSNFRDIFKLDAGLLRSGAARDLIDQAARRGVRQETPAPGHQPGVREAELSDGRWVQISERPTAEGGLVVTAADITALKTQEEAQRIKEEELRGAVAKLERSQDQLSELARKYEAEKIRAEQASAAKTEFLANMSHELRTPLNAINGFSEIMAAEMYGPLGEPRYRDYARDILGSGQHLLALINDILDMSKIEAGKFNLRFEPLSLEDLVEDAVRLVRNRAEAADLTLTVAFPPLPEVEADHRALKQVLLNLLSNAIKFTPRGGRITIVAELRDDPLGRQVRVGVQDTGIGIAPQDLERLARPFEQIESQHAKTTQGTGLGLALSKSLVEMHGGLLDLASAPGQGTLASFSIPIRQSEAAAA
jgi:two-component system cell cycle sensor histidine kinase PleC